ncbi:MAG: phenylpyruvate tautomerase MIF-related protein [Opitutales bacterium]
MPSLLCHHNATLSAEASQAFAHTLCRETASLLGKPPAYMLATVQQADAMSMDTNAEPAAVFHLEGLSLTADKVGPVVERLTALCTEHLRTAPSRVHIIAADIPRTHWGFDGKPMA